MNGFDMASHLFASLPMYMAYRTQQVYLLYFTVVTTIISLIYHSNENSISLHLDEFASCALIVVTFMTYVNDVYKPTYVALALLLAVVIIDYYSGLDIINFYVGFAAFVALVIFLYERRTVEEMPQRLKVKERYFISFVVTQCLAVAFFYGTKTHMHTVCGTFSLCITGFSYCSYSRKRRRCQTKGVLHTRIYTL